MTCLISPEVITSLASTDCPKRTIPWLFSLPRFNSASICANALNTGREALNSRSAAAVGKSTLPRFSNSGSPISCANRATDLRNACREMNSESAACVKLRIS